MALDTQTQGATMKHLDDDICGFCGLHGADKVSHPICWPNEDSEGTKYIHEACEDAECHRAHLQLFSK